MLRTAEAGDATAGRVQRLERRLARQVSAREEAESLLEQKSLELYALNCRLTELNAELEQRVRERTAELEAERRHALELAQRDVLTGLHNRRMFREHLESSLQQAGRGGTPAVLAIALDGFKAINDTLGYAAGDEVLKAVGQRLRACGHNSDIVARLGGDEFAILRPAVGQRRAAAGLAGRVLQALRPPLQIRGHVLVVGASIGIALAGEEAGCPDRLLQNAAIALYGAKAGGRGGWKMFHPEMDAELQARRALEADLRGALARSEFELMYQPLVDAGHGATTGFEALLRWHHPGRGMVPPDEFIPLAEETGLIRQIGAWALERSCADAAGWASSSIKVAVNLSPVQFQGGTLVGAVRHALAASGLPASRLELEVTESMLLQDTEATLGTLHQLRALGVGISMDDFGTGYSSLSYLQRFPFTKIKIDRSFISGLAQERSSLEIVRAVVSIGRALRMTILAEGVETEEQLRLLRSEGCDEVQGFLLGRPARNTQLLKAACASGSAHSFSMAAVPARVMACSSPAK
jgi:diguanylate cyclase (GGDEF)-like protein